MRILVLTNLYPPHYVGGYELRCRDVTEALHARGHQMHVLTSNHCVSSVHQQIDAGFSIQRALRLHGFFGHPWHGIRDLEELERYNNATLLDTIRVFNPDVVHVWNLGGLSKSLALTLQRLDIPTVFDVSDHWIARSLMADVWLDWWNRETGSFKTRLARGLWTVSGRREHLDRFSPTNPVHHLRFQRLYFCSAKLREITLEAGYPVEHGAVIHCPVDTASYHGDVKPVERPMAKLLYAGRLSPDKGILTVLKAMNAVKGKFSGSLHVYGKGEPEYECLLKAYATLHELPVVFASATPAEMPEVYRSHDALLFPSEWEEPFALTPLEAMASGLPVIGTMTGGSTELLKHGENALTYAAGNVEELSVRILELAAQPQLRNAIATQGQAHVRQHFNLPAVVSQIETYLEDSVREWMPVKLPHYLAV